MNFNPFHIDTEALDEETVRPKRISRGVIIALLWIAPKSCPLFLKLKADNLPVASGKDVSPRVSGMCPCLADDLAA